MSLQAKLLRVLQEREFTPLGETKARKFDVKIISASSVSLAQAVRDGRFREDLRYRLEVIPLHLPPLRDRVEDIEILFDHYLQYQFERHGLPIKPVDSEVYRVLRAHSWPGNVRELINVCVYIVALSSDDDSTVTVSKLPQSMIFKPPVFVAHSSAVVSATADRPLINRQSLQQAMHDFGGHRENIAAYFGVSRMTLWRKLKKFGLA
jgi:transcriptional regulator with PAS, ATPase and Fis domain